MPDGHPKQAPLRSLGDGSYDALDPNLVAAWVDGVLDEHEHERLDALVRSDPEALLLARALRAERGRRRRLALRTLAAAAVAAVVVVAFGVWQRPGRPGSGPGDIEQRLIAAAGSLRTQYPQDFPTFEPLAPDAGTLGGAVRSGGTAWLEPRGSVREVPSTLRWRLPADATRARLTLRGPALAWVQEVEGDHADAPELVPGRYIVTLQPLDGLGQQPIKRAFSILDEDERAAYEQARSRLRDAAPSDLRDLLEAHHALHVGLLTEAAEAALRAHDAGGAYAQAAARVLERVRPPAAE